MPAEEHLRSRAFNTWRSSGVASAPCKAEAGTPVRWVGGGGAGACGGVASVASEGRSVGRCVVDRVDVDVGVGVDDSDDGVGGVEGSGVGGEGESAVGGEGDADGSCECPSLDDAVCSTWLASDSDCGDGGTVLPARSRATCAADPGEKTVPPPPRGAGVSNHKQTRPTSGLVTWCGSCHPSTCQSCSFWYGISGNHPVAYVNVNGNGNVMA